MVKISSISEKCLMHKLKKKKKIDDKKEGKITADRFLIHINIIGSAGPIRFVVNGNENAACVIECALKLYAREERIPVLGTDANSFLLYPANVGLDALKAYEAIGSCGVRNFVLCKNQTETRSHVIDQKGHGWRACFQKSIKIRSH